ncbi:MAG TPA: hypothetical protein PLU22_08955 [Polyangiaceae bacterium]|nr:hypothetical protein [Polyangiaceae bacterium]
MAGQVGLATLLVAGAALLAASAGACAGSARPSPPRSGQPGAATSRPPASTAATAAGLRAASAGAPAPGAPGTSQTGGADALPAVTVPFTRELDEPVSGLAIGDRRAAALGAVPYLRDRGQWRPIPLPAGVTQARRSKLDVYMGRDDRPRIMGYWWTEEPASPATRRPLYLRYREAGWAPAPDELGRLGGDRPGALFGVLGYDEPEVVCKEGDLCLVKRRTGWSTVAGIELSSVRLAGGGVFALLAGGLSRLEAGGFAAAPVGVPGATVRDIWELGPDDRWVIVEGPPSVRLVRLIAGQAQEHPAPIVEPRALWASGEDDVWVAGDGGLAWFDGRVFRRVLGPDPPLVCVVGRGRETLWVAGPKGVFRREARPGTGDSPG